MLDEMRFSMAKEYEDLVPTAVVLVPYIQEKDLVAPQTPGPGGPTAGGGWQMQLTESIVTFFT